MGNLFIHYLRVKDQHSPPVKRVGIYSQERQGDVAVDLGLDGDLDLEVEVKTELQGSLGGATAWRSPRPTICPPRTEDLWVGAKAVAVSGADIVMLRK